MTFPTQEHIEAAQTAAARVKKATGFYCWPSVTLAQAAIESAGWTKLAGTNNGFGIKATRAQIVAGRATLRKTREVIDGKDVYIEAWFANFDSLADAYESHANLFVRVGVYAPALKATTARAFVAAMAPHYATATNYASVIIGVMNNLKLDRYDAPETAVSGKAPLPAPFPAQPAPLPSSPSPALPDAVGPALPRPATSWLGLLWSWLFKRA